MTASGVDPGGARTLGRDGPFGRRGRPGDFFPDRRLSMGNKAKSFSIIDKGLTIDGTGTCNGRLIIKGTVQGVLEGETIVIAEEGNVMAKTKAVSLTVGGKFRWGSSRFGGTDSPAQRDLCGKDPLPKPRGRGPGGSSMPRSAASCLSRRSRSGSLSPADRRRHRGGSDPTDRHRLPPCPRPCWPGG